MKYLKIFENFTRIDTKELSMDDAIALFNEHCKNYDFNSKYKLSRSIRLDYNKSYYINPMLYKRTSISDIPNIYTMMMDNEPEWSEYPKRSHGLIGYISDIKRADYVVIPYDNAEIAVCLRVDDI